MITKLLAERQQLEGLSMYPTLKDTPELPATSPDFIHKRKYEMRLTFSDQDVVIPMINTSSPQSTATLFTCISSASDYEASECSSESPSEYASSLNEHSPHLQHASTDADNSVRFQRSVSDIGERAQGENDTLSPEGVHVIKNLDCQALVNSLELRRDTPPTVFLFDMEGLTKTCEPFKHEKIIMSQGSDSIKDYKLKGLVAKNTKLRLNNFN